MRRIVCWLLQHPGNDIDVAPGGARATRWFIVDYREQTHREHINTRRYGSRLSF
jgi:hypothetical protein